MEHIAPAKKGRRSGNKISRLLRELSDDEMENNDDGELPIPSAAAAAAPVDERKPWLKDFNYYINMFDQLSENQTIVQWWGVSFDSDDSWSN